MVDDYGGLPPHHLSHPDDLDAFNAAMIDALS